MSDLLLLCEYGSLNGGEHSLLALLPGLLSRGLSFVAAAPSPSPLARRFAELDIETWDWTLSPGGSQAKRREQLDVYLRRRPFALLHANSLAMSRLAGPVAEATRTPSLGHIRDIVRLSGQAIADVNRNQRLLCVSEATRRWHVDQGILPERSFVLYNGVDLDAFRPRPATCYLHRELGIAAGSMLVATIGQLGLRKGWDVWLEAAHRLADAGIDLHLLLVGERYSSKQEALDFEHQVRSAAEQGALRGRCHFLGTRADIPQLLNECELLVHPARQEPLGRVLLESAASGTPVVATEVGGTREIFPESEARLVAPDDPAALAAAVEVLLHDKPALAAMAQRARRRMERHFAVETAVENLAEHYRAVQTASPL